MKSRRVFLSKNGERFSIMTHCVKSKQATVACQNIEILL